ncbi:MAG: hypothetical protein H7174_02250 [Flavobacterium sp.]|nr:hypothetical protein [Flavobacterium sp.]
MENSNNNNLDKQNPGYGSADADSGNHSDVNDNQYRQNSELKNQSNVIDGITNGEQNSDSYQNENQKRFKDDDLYDNENEEESDDDVDDQDLDENGFPRSKDSSFPSSI